jgi:ketosteroid isomerase-like protein
MSDTTALIDRYFDLAARPDSDAYFALFTDDATLEDEGTEHHGLEAIRAWRTSVPRVTYTVTDTDTDQVSGATEVSAEIAGDFPGSPVALRFRFETADDQRIRVLRIRP